MAEPCPTCGQVIPSVIVTITKLARDPSVPCSDCGCKWLYSDYYDQCFECGRNVGRPDA